jgi:hypothetical protein
MMVSGCWVRCTNGSRTAGPGYSSQFLSVRERRAVRFAIKLQVAHADHFLPLTARAPGGFQGRVLQNCLAD